MNYRKYRNIDYTYRYFSFSGSAAIGTPVAYIEIPSGGSMQEITAPVKGLSGNNDLYFVFNSNISMDSWSLS